MSLTKFTHKLLKHHQASWRPSIKRKRLLKNANVDLQK